VEWLEWLLDLFRGLGRAAYNELDEDEDEDDEDDEDDEETHF